jgi:hypothetical protein
MFLVGILSWWYSDGWKKRLEETTSRLSRLSDYFSIRLLFSTLFAPFRQISSSGVNGSLSDQMRGLFDQILSRFIGLFVRLGMIIFGTITIVIVGLWSLFIIIVWAIIPLFPVIGMIGAVIGWVPTWQ